MFAATSSEEKKKSSSSRALKRPRRRRRGLRSGGLSTFLAALVVALALVVVFRPQARDSSASSVAVRVAGTHDTILLPTPTTAIARGQLLSEVAFVRTKWPKDKLDADYLTDIDSYREARAATALPANLPVPRGALSFAKNDANAVIEGIPEGFRAITVRVDDESAIEGWARSGSYVDVIVLRKASERGKGIEARIIAENVKILSAGRSAKPLSSDSSAPRAPSTVTLLVSQEDALRIKTAARVGKLTFSLRGFGDGSPTLSRSLYQNELLDGAPAQSIKSRIQGKATGPDGKTYVLSEDARWIPLVE